MATPSLSKKLKTTKSAYERMIEMQVKDLYAMPTDDDAPRHESNNWLQMFGRK